ncbi:hypothetical protein OUZ56_022781 [Daphnia magna]|uniref:Uncharacterized protein n=1 Tax=Daphnia magna TaxID=35525 RepID=A0ABR0AXG5_9CRUS|nr:hypothetical protein OUZ56_022781 [Daphnia magna]
MEKDEERTRFPIDRLMKHLVPAQLINAGKSAAERETCRARLKGDVRPHLNQATGCFDMCLSVSLFSLAWRFLPKNIPVVALTKTKNPPITYTVNTPEPPRKINHKQEDAGSAKDFDVRLSLFKKGE